MPEGARRRTALAHLDRHEEEPKAAAALRRDAVADMLHPSSIALVGASPHRNSIGGRALRSLVGHGYQGELYLVNPTHESIAGRHCYPTVSSIGRRVDLAVMAVASHRLQAAIEDCGAAGVKTAVVFAAGFAEAGADGARAQEALIALAHTSGIRICGPNSLGVMNFRSGMMASFSSLLEQPIPRAGSIGLVSQSGALASYILAKSVETGAGFASFVSTGNEADVTLSDVIDHHAGSADSRGVLGYVEEVRDGERFIAACAKAMEQQKPIVLLKVGRSPAGAKVAASHTGAMVGSAESFDAACRRLNVISVASVDEMVDLAQLIDFGFEPRGGRVGILSISGGAAALIVDACSENGLQVPELSSTGRAGLADVPFAVGGNPVDFTAQALSDPTIFSRCLDILASEESIDALCVFFAQAVGHDEELGLEFARRVVAARERSGKPVVAIGLAGTGPVAQAFVEARIPMLFDPGRAIRSMAHLSRQRQAGIARLPHPRYGSKQVHPPPPDASEQQQKQLLSDHGIPLAREGFAGDRESAVAIATEIGYPVAMKVSSRDILHKTDVNGVRLDLAGPNDVRAAFDSITLTARRRRPSARVDGVSIQAMIPAGLEVLVGVTTDPSFGLVLACGLGGIHAETIDDVAARILPIDIGIARQMLQELRGYRLFEGTRGRSRADVDSLAHIMVQVSDFASAAKDWLIEMDLNPVIVLEDGSGCMVADAKIVPRTAK